jgi:phospholipid/cholesterol/gamma-HCH transport system permease protein
MPLAEIDSKAREIVLTIQDYSISTWRAVTNLFRPPIYWGDMLIQADVIGVGSTTIVILVGFFTGGVLAIQSLATLAAFGATNMTGRFVSLTMVRELGPVLTGIMVAGRNASSIASELGSMVVSEQIDAMRALGVDPLRKLVLPRIVATVIMLFFLTIVADSFGTCGGASVAILLNNLNSTQYFTSAYESLVFSDILRAWSNHLSSGSLLPASAVFTGCAQPAARRVLAAPRFRPSSLLPSSLLLPTFSSVKSWSRSSSNDNGKYSYRSPGCSGQWRQCLTCGLSQCEHPLLWPACPQGCQLRARRA